MTVRNTPEKDDKNDKNGGDYRPPQRQYLIWIAILCLIPILIVFRDSKDSRIETVDYRQFTGMVESNLIAKGAVINYTPQNEIRVIEGEYLKAGEKDPVPFKIDTPLSEEFETELLLTGNFDSKTPNTLMANVFFTLLPFILIALLLYFFLFRQIRMAGKGAMSFGKSKARLLNKDRNKTTFRDVAGVDEAKDEVSELVDFLKDPKKFQKLGGRIPKGILMIGAPGTGKTLLAKAIAGEADASFFSISGSDFVEMFVGVGASRVRDMFEQARKNTPCLIFIDEIDAVGRSRGHGLGGGNDEREQTLNALLVEMDGFDTQEGIIIIAATNRPDVLDPALLRPGRFDRQITVALPDVRGREEILKVHAKRIKLKPSVDLSVTARGTPGFSGAELANLLNEAALLAARNNKKAVGMIELEEARDKVRWGRERRSLAMTEEEKKNTAWHEAGHALVNVVLEHTHPLHKVTIIPRGQSLGSTMWLPKEDLLSRRRKELLDIIAVTMAGRIAEEVVAMDISSGATGDIQQATQIAHAMVCQWGMSDKMGMVQYGDDSEFVFLGKEMAKPKGYSEKTAQEIDNEVKRIIDESFARAKKVIEDHGDRLKMIAEALLEFETLDGQQVEDIVSKGSFTPPETPEDVKPPTGAPAATTVPEISTPERPGLDPGLGSPEPAAI
ncbi:MAG: cell division protease FtsH [Limisphaerales bacterium]|jgi:cell division protease FtsH